MRIKIFIFLHDNTKTKFVGNSGLEFQYSFMFFIHNIRYVTTYTLFML